MSEENKKFELNEEEIEKVVGGSLANAKAIKKIKDLLAMTRKDLREAQESGDAEEVARLQAIIKEYNEQLKALSKLWKAKNMTNLFKSNKHIVSNNFYFLFIC